MSIDRSGENDPPRGYAAGLTARTARFAIDPALAFPDAALDVARLSILDALVVAQVGLREPVSTIVRTFIAAEGGAPQATVLGSSQRLPARAAALANGTAAHALDYDDSHFGFVGHPTAAVLPAALAMAEALGRSGRELLEAFLVGVETACRVGAYFGRRHYNAGFHQTATAGAFGATTACARLLRLSETQTRHALGLVSTRASGLKSQFGTMGKPYHAGMAAANGVEAARLAELGFEARTNGIECADGFAATHAAEGGPDNTIFAGLPARFSFTDVLYKYHACCHGTHPTLEALLTLKAQHALPRAAIGRVDIAINPQWLAVCCIPHPATGLEAKFSLALVSAMVLHDINTGALDSYSAERCHDAALQGMMGKIVIHGDSSLSDTTSRVSIDTKDGQRLTATVDLSAAVPLDVKTRKLCDKAAALLGTAEAEAAWQFSSRIEHIAAGQLGDALRAVLAASGPDHPPSSRSQP